MVLNSLLLISLVCLIYHSYRVHMSQPDISLLVLDRSEGYTHLSPHEHLSCHHRALEARCYHFQLPRFHAMDIDHMASCILLVY